MSDQLERTPAEGLLEEVELALRGIICQTLHVTLDPRDDRRDNSDALDILGEIQLALLAKLDEAGKKRGSRIADFQGYAATVAYNKCYEYLRKKRPNRMSLQNRLRYFFRHRDGYALWTTAKGDLLCGPAKWQDRSSSTESGAKSPLTYPLPLNLHEIVPGAHLRHYQQMDARDWDRLLMPIFERVQRPIALDELVTRLVPLVGADDSAESPPEPASPQTQEQREIFRDLLKRFWGVIVELEPRKRFAYLLNPTWFEIEEFTFNSIVTIAEIGAALDMTDEHYALLWNLLPLDEPTRHLAGTLRTPEEKFALVWRYLPLPDATIARLLGVERMDVINLRMMARRRFQSQLVGLLA